MLLLLFLILLYFILFFEEGPQLCLVGNKLFLSSEKNWDLGDASEEHRVQNKGALMFRILQVLAGGCVRVRSQTEKCREVVSLR